MKLALMSVSFDPLMYYIHIQSILKVANCP